MDDVTDSTMSYGILLEVGIGMALFRKDYYRLKPMVMVAVFGQNDVDSWSIITRRDDPFGGFGF